MTETELKARAWDSLMGYFRGRTLSLREARRVVGGQAHLETLLRDGKIREIDNGSMASNAKRMFPADQVFAHVRSVTK